MTDKQRWIRVPLAAWAHESHTHESPTMNISDLTEERRGYANGHPRNRDALRFLVLEQGSDGATTHSVCPDAFDDLDQESRAKGWGHKVGSLRTMCGWGDITLDDLVPNYAAPRKQQVLGSNPSVGSSPPFRVQEDLLSGLRGRIRVGGLATTLLAREDLLTGRDRRALAYGFDFAETGVGA